MFQPFERLGEPGALAQLPARVLGFLQLALGDLLALRYSKFFVESARLLYGTLNPFLSQVPPP